MSAQVGTFNVSEQDARGTWLIALEGEHDMSTTPLLQRETRPLWSRCARAVVDLSDATFIDSSVINWLIRGHLDSGGREGARVVVIDGPPGSAVNRILEVTGVRSLLRCCATRQEASELLDAAGDDVAAMRGVTGRASCQAPRMTGAAPWRRGGASRSPIARE